MVKTLTQPQPHWRLNPLLQALGAVLLLFSTQPYAREYYFPPTGLEGDAALHEDVDLSLFSNNKAQLPGTYSSTIVINKQRSKQQDINYLNDASGELQPQITPAMLRDWGVRVEAFSELAALPTDKPLPKALGEYITAATAIFDFNAMMLRISMPQAALDEHSRGSVDPSRWDNGVPVLFANYTFSGSQNDSGNGGTDKNQYLNLQSGLNLGGWRLRNYATWDKNDDEQSWQSLQTYIQHDVQFLKSQFTAGENSTRGEVFDSVQYQGVNLASDENMLPFSQRGFAPTIRGIANSNAEVSVRQNGYLIYQANVAPGAFEINDISSTSNSGDMEVTIKEADGSERHFTQPYSSVAVMLRPGRVKYEVTAARYRANNNSGDKEPMFVQGSAIYGLNNIFTLFGGLTAAEDYQAGVGGVGVALGTIGSVSADVTWAKTTLDNGEQHDGQSYRLLYSKNIETTDTNITLASYRYSTSGYYSFADANQRIDDDNGDDDWRYQYNKRNRIQASISQSIFSSSLYLNGYQQDYWGTSRKERNLSAGFSTTVNGISYHLAYTYSKNDDSDSDRIVSFSLSVPLSRWLPNSWASYNISNSQRGDTNQNVGLGGTLLDDQRLSYSLQQSHTNHDGTDNSSIYSTYRSQYANLSGGYYYASDDSRQISYSVSGAVVAHPHGVTLAQPLSSEFAIVDTDEASGLRFQNQRGVQSDSFGNAIIPSLSAYQENRIVLDTTTLPDDVDTNATVVTVVPTRNAAVTAHFSTWVGYRVLVTLRRESGSPVPFGAFASVDGQTQTGIVDENGVLYLAGIADGMDITVKWGDGPEQQCRATLALATDSDSNNPTGIRNTRAQCLQEKKHAQP